MGSVPLPRLGLSKGRVGHLPKRKDVRVFGEGELVFLCVGRQLTDDLRGQVAQPAALDTQLVITPGEAKHRVSPVSQPSEDQSSITDPKSLDHLCWLSCVPPPSLAPHQALPDLVLEAKTQWEVQERLIWRETPNTQTVIVSLRL